MQTRLKLNVREVDIKPKLLIGLCLAFVGLAMIGGWLFLNRTNIVKLADSWAIIPRPQRYSELYFCDYKKMSGLKPGIAQTVSFEVFNGESQNMTYHYNLVARTADDAEVNNLSDGLIVVPQDQTRKVDADVVLPDFGKQTSVEASITYQSVAWGRTLPSQQIQAIHYWLGGLGMTTGTLRYE